MEKWFERSFNVLDPSLRLPGIVERLKGTPWRLRGILSVIPAHDLTARSGDHWSIQENVGHLLDLEPLWLQRIRELMDKKREMYAADLKNTSTSQAAHNESNIEDILSAFTIDRMLLISAFENLSVDVQLHQCLHPRLKVPMRPVDLGYFVAEHDDHHLARISEIGRELKIW
jgi:uncharacterized damage-inducible protein DinB